MKHASALPGTVGRHGRQNKVVAEVPEVWDATVNFVFKGENA
ncbi:MAG: hypothetical protein PHT48_10105 [Dechloromonas sp.]|nr:hypothetical protein [Dechloromonas sp.]